MARLPVPATVTANLAQRYRVRAEAERELVAYLSGVLDALGIDPERMTGFDDTTGELLLTDPPEDTP